MLIVLMLFLFLTSIFVLILKRNRETFYIFGMCMSLAIMFSGILLYIAKKGGISRELQEFLFLNIKIKMQIQYFLINVYDMGYTIAIGRHLFPMFLLFLALHFSMIPWLQRNYWVKRLTFVMPVLSLIIYYPPLFSYLTSKNESLQQIIAIGTIVWIVLYTIISIGLLLFEAYSIEMKFFQRKFILITSFILSLILFYFLYFGQDPAQVYQFYSFKTGIYYMNTVLSIPTYIFIVFINVIFAIIGFASLMKYTNDIVQSSKEEVIIQRKFDAISTGTSVFVHSIKNQLLANRVIFKRINNNLDDLEKVKEYTDTLSKQNENILMRIEELYRSVKANSVYLIPVSLSDVVESALERFNQKFPDKIVELNLMVIGNVLADKNHLSEAAYNLLSNAQEAVNSLPDGEGRIVLSCYNVRQYTVIEVKDNGIGFSKEDAKKICEPYFTKKNSNYNWGMGLHYVRSIVKEHFGSLRYESKEDNGSTFYLLLPKYK
ncbi:HAMP domain-containing histidine kinase [Psychrobacillus sp. INOP01]|uniref:sensor histidine kinase n=1 Tax=Psychrobacillus sp. INOP01 TaxID=2829187 RepID=UPI001BAA23AD|nr:HAMP domain-containing sensor histidine kinase [Psychrobacillus sp. INOP01]QUG40703.1 HAMP domain-containing histidine kinase [Psychrobacillus sp. INOP01]